MLKLRIRSINMCIGRNNVRFTRYERSLTPKFAAVTCTSDIDRAVFERHLSLESRGNIEIIPNGVDVTHLPPQLYA